MEFREVLVAGGKALGIDIRRDMLDLFDLHYQALVEFGMETNLTSIEGREEVAVKHFLDSLVCSKAIEIEDDWRVVDVGTGAGFPGIPLKVQKPVSYTHLDVYKRQGHRDISRRHDLYRRCKLPFGALWTTCIYRAD